MTAVPVRPGPKAINCVGCGIAFTSIDVFITHPCVRTVRWEPAWKRTLVLLFAAPRTACAAVHRLWRRHVPGSSSGRPTPSATHGPGVGRALHPTSKGAAR